MMGAMKVTNKAGKANRKLSTLARGELFKCDDGEYIYMKGSSNGAQCQVLFLHPRPGHTTLRVDHVVQPLSGELIIKE